MEDAAECRSVATTKRRLKVVAAMLVCGCAAMSAIGWFVFGGRGQEDSPAHRVAWYSDGLPSDPISSYDLDFSFLMYDGAVWTRCGSGFARIDPVAMRADCWTVPHDPIRATVALAPGPRGQLGIA